MTSADAVGAVVVVGLAMSVAAAWPIYKGWQRRARYRLVRDTEVETPDTATPGNTVLLTGTARTRESPIHAPLSERDALVAAWSISEWQDENLQLKYWSPEARGLRSGAFEIESDGAFVTVPAQTCEGSTTSTTSMLGYDAVTGFDMESTLVEVESFDFAEEIPQTAEPPAQFHTLERQVGLQAPDPGVTLVDLGRKHGARRYHEAIVEPGDTLTIRATPETTGDGAKVLAPPERGPMIISDLDPDTLTWRYRWSYLKLFYGSITVILAMMLLSVFLIAIG